jgi:hypothetical protein
MVPERHGEAEQAIGERCLAGGVGRTSEQTMQDVPRSRHRDRRGGGHVDDDAKRQHQVYGRNDDGEQRD